MSADAKMCQTIFRKVNSTWKKQFAPQNTRNHANGAEPNNDPGFTVRVKARPGQAALKSVRAIPNPRPADRRPKETRRPRSELIATPAKQPPIELGHSRNSELPLITPMAADNKAGRPAGRLRHGLFPICEYRRHLRLRNSDFRAAEHDLPSTGRTLEQPWPPPKLCQFRLTI